MESKLEFSRVGEQWEAISKIDGSLVIAVDCTQDSETQSSGMSRELMTGIQQLRKAAGLDMKDIVEVFFAEEDGVSFVEKAVGGNLAFFEAKLRGVIPLPRRYAPKWAVALKSDTVEIGGASVVVSICRPAVTVRDDLDVAAASVLSTMEPSLFPDGDDFSFIVDGSNITLKYGTDYWKNSLEKLRATKALEWL